MRSWQFIAVATVLYFGSAAPAAADELPLVPTSADTTAMVESITADVNADVAAVTADVTAPAPEAAPAATSEAEPAAAPEAAPTAEPAPQAQQESQYQAPEAQYQPPAAETTASDTAAAAPPSSTSSSASEASSPPPTPDAAVTTTAATADHDHPAEAAGPDTWVWNWTWNCDSRTEPAAGLPDDAQASTWIWNWTWNCDENGITPTDSQQYQNVTSQYQPENANVSIRIGSPGDNGPVTQTIVAAAEAVANTTATVVQEVGSAGLSPPAALPPIVVPALPPIPVETFPPITVDPGLPPIELPLGPLPPFSLPPLPAIEISIPVVPAPTTATAIAEAVEEVLEGVGIPAAATRSAAPSRPRSVNARVPQHGAEADAGASLTVVDPVRSSAPVAQSNAGTTRGGPLVPPRPDLPLPNAPAMGGVQTGSSANGILAAFAALLAAYFLFPYLAALPVRWPRDRRRLRPRAGRFDPPG